jgi:protein-tyrosine phosphatase
MPVSFSGRDGNRARRRTYPSGFPTPIYDPPVNTRRIDLTGPCNFRDLGGYSTVDGHTTRWGRLYRSDSMHTLTDTDLPMLRELGVRTAIDFRSTPEIEETGIGPLHDASIRHVHSPTFDGTRPSERISLPTGDWNAADFYLRMLSSGAAAYVLAATTLMEPDAMPAVFYCMAGKDRTGVFAALVLGLLGVPDDVIVADYVLTHERLDVITARRIERAGVAAEATRWANLPDDLQGAHAHTMEGLIERVHDRWGTWAACAAAIGIPDDTVAGLRAQLLEP